MYSWREKEGECGHDVEMNRERERGNDEGKAKS